MDNRIGEMQVFVRVVEAGSFSAAARALGMTPSTISKLIGRCEARLQARLLERSTRRLVLTHEGQRYYDHSVRLLAELDEVERDLSCQAGSARGTVRVNASVGFGIHALEPLLPSFWRAHPGITLDLALSDEIVDLYLDRTDVAFRVGPLPDSTLVARNLGSARRRIVGSPAYLARRGRPRVIDDLSGHNCLGFNFRRSAPTWSMQRDGQPVEQPIAGALLANNGECLRRMVLAGVGLARLGDFHVREDLAAGRVIEVLADAAADDDEAIHAVTLGGSRLPARVRLFLDFVCPRLQAWLKAGREEAKPSARRRPAGQR